MTVGEYKGQKVQDCKLLVRKQLTENGEAFIFGESEKEVISRSGDICVVAETQQWFIDYSDPKWKEATLEALELVDCYADEIKNQFDYVIKWLRQWAVSRNFGLGTKLPWDQQYLIDSLSDSTIYNAFYTIAIAL